MARTEWLENGMLAAGKWVLGIVSGGLVLGAVLGEAADPTIKDAPKQWWQLTGRDDFDASAGYEFVEAGPSDLNVFGGFRPDLDYDAEVWAQPLPDIDWAAFEDTYNPPAFEPWEPETAEPLEASTVDLAADQAEAAVEDAQAEAANPAPAAEQTTELAALY